MTFGLWETNNLQRIYVNNIPDYGGLCYLSKGRENSIKITLEPSIVLPQAKLKMLKDLVERKIEDELGEGKPTLFPSLVKYVSLKPSPRQNTNRYGASPHKSVQHREKEAERLVIGTIGASLYGKDAKVVTVIIDHREPKELAELISQHPLMDVRVETLELGDILVDDTILIERKDCTYENHSTDFENSIIGEDKRLFNQSERLKMQSQYLPIILLEGSCYNNSQSMLIQQIDGAISFLAVVQRLSILQTYNLHHTAYMITKLALHIKNGLGYEIGLREGKPKQLLDKKAFVLEGITGVSAKIARGMISHFGSVKAVVNASEAELLKVKGLGKVKVKQILEILG